MGDGLFAREVGDLGEQRVVDLTPQQRVGSIDGDDRGGDGGERDRQRREAPSASSCTDAAAPTTAISIALRYSRRTYALPDIAGRARKMNGNAQLARRRRRASRPGPQFADRYSSRARCRLQFDLGAEHHERCAGVHRRRGVHDVAADRADVARRR